MQETQTPDAILIDRFKRGDSSAMDALVGRHLPRLDAYAMRLTHDRDRAGDVIGATLSRMSRAAVKFKGKSSFGTYMYTATRNCFLDQRNKELSRPTESLSDPGSGEEGPIERQFHSTAASPYEILERKDRAESLGWAVEQLPENQKSIVKLFYMEMHSYEQMAAELSVPIGTIKSRLNRARSLLKTLLEQAAWASEPPAMAA